MERPTVYYRYPLGSVVLGRFVALLMLALSLFIIGTLLIFLLCAIVTSSMNFTTEKDATYIGLAILTFLAGAVSINQFPQIGTNDKGILVKVFLIKWVFIPWEDVLDLRLSPITIYSRASQLYLLQTKGFAPWFNIINWAHLTGWRVGIPISSEIQGFDELLQTVEEHLGQRDEPR